MIIEIITHIPMTDYIVYKLEIINQDFSLLFIHFL